MTDEAGLARVRAYKAANRERIKEKMQQYYIDNRERILAKARKDKLDDPGRFRRYAEKHAEKHAEKRKEEALARARAKHAQCKAKFPDRYPEDSLEEWLAVPAAEKRRRRLASAGPRKRSEQDRARDAARYRRDIEASRAKSRETAAREQRDHPEKVRARKNALRACAPEKARVKERAYRTKNIDAIHVNEYRSRHRRETSKDPAIVEELINLSRINSIIKKVEYGAGYHGIEDNSKEAIVYREKIRQHVEKYPEKYIQKMSEVFDTKQEKSK